MRGKVAAVVVALGVLGAAGCGGGGGDNGESKKTGPQVAADAAQALQDAGAVHVNGTVTASGKQQQLDVQLQGQQGSGTVTIDGQPVHFVNTDGKAYFQAPAAFWQQTGVPAQAASTIDNKWVAVPAQAAAELNDISLDGLAKELRNPTDGKIKDEVRTDKLDGQKVVVVTQDDGSELYVAATGKPYPLKTVNKGQEPGTVTFGDFGKQQTIAAPPNPLVLGQTGAGAQAA